MQGIGFLNPFARLFRRGFAALVIDVVRCAVMGVFMALAFVESNADWFALLMLALLCLATSVLNIDAKHERLGFDRESSMPNWRNAITLVIACAICVLYPTWWIIICTAGLRIVIEIAAVLIWLQRAP